MNFADNTSALEIARARYPEATSLRLVDHGYDNIAVLVDEEVVLRFPRNAAALQRDEYERYILDNIQGANVGIDLPYVLDENKNPPYFITRFVPGEHLKPLAIRAFAPEVQRAIGAQVARFAFAVHAALPVDDLRSIRLRLQLDDQADGSWEVSIRKYVLEYAFPSPSQDQVAKDYYRKWRELPMLPAVVVHDDLHTDNLLFVDEHLRGALDFGDTTIGTAEQELRHLYWINEHALKSGIETYEQLAGRSLDIEASKVWAVMQELAAYGGRGSAGQFTHPSYIRARGNLNRWFHTDIWR